MLPPPPLKILANMTCSMVRFLNVDHARCALIAMQNSFLEFGAEFADDPCAESLSTIGKPM